LWLIRCFEVKNSEIHFKKPPGAGPIPLPQSPCQLFASELKTLIFPIPGFRLGKVRWDSSVSELKPLGFPIPGWGLEKLIGTPGKKMSRMSRLAGKI
jgi:hypothetical protein